MNQPVVIDFDFENVLSLSKTELQAAIYKLEEALKLAPQLEIEVRHNFANKGTERGAYTREITIEKNAIIIGKQHKFETINILAQGNVTVISIDGAVRLKAPATFVSSPGAKRVILAHEESVWINVHATQHDDPDKIELEVIETKELSQSNFKEEKCLGQQ